MNHGYTSYCNFFPCKGNKRIHTGDWQKIMRISIYSKMFLFNTKSISHFCLMALGIAGQGNGFLSNVLLIVSAWHTWHRGVKIKEQVSLQGIGLTWSDHNLGPCSKIQFPPAVIYHTVTNTFTKWLPWRRQQLNEDKLLSGKQSCYKMREPHDIRYKLFLTSLLISLSLSLFKTLRIMSPKSCPSWAAEPKSGPAGVN